MSDDYFSTSRSDQLSIWVAKHMLKGAGWAALVVVGVVLFIWVTYGIGLLLPEESRETPSPYGALEVPVVQQLA